MLLTEYDEKKVMECLKQEARDEGKAEGLAEGLAKGKAEGIAEGAATTIISLVKSGIITLEQGATQLGISINQINNMTSVR